MVVGALAGLATLPARRHGADAGFEAVAHCALFGLATAGLALLPDSDHHDASFAHAAGPLSWVIAHVVGLLFGGHRYGMHSIPGTALVAALVAWGTLWAPSRGALTAVAVLLAICIAAGLKATRFARGSFEALLVGCALSALVMWSARADLWWLFALGMALHIAEDELTGHGCALLWPFTRRRFGGDGRQPAAEGRRKPSGSPRRQPPRRRPPARRVRPSARRPDGIPVPVLPSGRRLTWDVGGRCVECLTRDHGECRDRGCGCTRGRHPLRPVPASPRPVVPVVDDGAEPPF
jgi:membrane-bound metal-dependent hydrolase YbcI (DUF457 family)